MGRIKGAAILARLDYVRSRLGEDTLARVLADLAPMDRTILSGTLLPSIWYPFQVLVRLDDALARSVPGEEAVLFDEAGAHVARQHARTLYRVFFREADPDRVLRVASCVFSSYYAGLGRASVAGEEAGHRSVRVDRAAVAARGHCQATLAYFREVLVACTGLRIVARETRCRCWGDEGCEFDLAWEAALKPAVSG